MIPENEKQTAQCLFSPDTQQPLLTLLLSWAVSACIFEKYLYYKLLPDTMHYKEFHIPPRQPLLLSAHPFLFFPDKNLKSLQDFLSLHISVHPVLFQS